MIFIFLKVDHEMLMTSTYNCKENNLHTVRFLIIYRLTRKIPFIINIIQNPLFILLVSISPFCTLYFLSNKTITLLFTPKIQKNSVLFCVLTEIIMNIM